MWGGGLPDERGTRLEASLLDELFAGYATVPPSSPCLQLASIGCPNEEPMRRDLREMLFTAPGIENYISGVVSARQRWASGGSLQAALTSAQGMPIIFALTTVLQTRALMPPCLPACRPSRLQVQFFEVRLKAETAPLAKGFDAVCIFVSGSWVLATARFWC